MGKPDKIIYKSAMEMAAVDASDCIAIGDSLHHDIKGANAAEIASAFITGGIQATELGLTKFGEVADDDSGSHSEMLRKVSFLLSAQSMKSFYIPNTSQKFDMSNTSGEKRYST
ncbi:hypothetical protein CQW23_31969 [Capsicum baccatum]|uniref:Uncharacterized protein n=1 Tax=Capsicum baccatum TaxID=33114 RepID=A0A2G2V645_CAPBA|nr:hypothetical protein CQW23_31969 [Capsicum baccatum]